MLRKRPRGWFRVPLEPGKEQPEEAVHEPEGSSDPNNLTVEEAAAAEDARKEEERAARAARLDSESSEEPQEEPQEEEPEENSGEEPEDQENSPEEDSSEDLVTAEDMIAVADVRGPRHRGDLDPEDLSEDLSEEDDYDHTPEELEEGREWFDAKFINDPGGDPEDTLDYFTNVDSSTKDNPRLLSAIRKAVREYQRENTDEDLSPEDDPPEGSSSEGSSSEDNPPDEGPEDFSEDAGPEDTGPAKVTVTEEDMEFAHEMVAYTIEHGLSLDSIIEEVRAKETPERVHAMEIVIEQLNAEGENSPEDDVLDGPEEDINKIKDDILTEGLGATVSDDGNVDYETKQPHPQILPENE